MSERDIELIAENSRFVVSGYAFSRREDSFISILNLNHPDCAMVVNDDSEIIETNMDPIEQRIVLELCRKNLQFMEEADA